MTEEITEQAWNEWKANPTTKAFFEALEEERNAVRDAIPRVDPTNQTEMIGKVMRLSVLEDMLQISLGGEE